MIRRFFEFLRGLYLRWTGYVGPLPDDLNRVSDDIFAETMRRRGDRLANNATVNPELLARLRRRGMIRDGAVEIGAQFARPSIFKDIEVSLGDDLGFYCGTDENHLEKFDPSKE